MSMKAYLKKIYLEDKENKAIQKINTRVKHEFKIFFRSSIEI